MRTSDVVADRSKLLVVGCRLQVWFQNRRSKDRRMKQLNALGARRHQFFRAAHHRLRPLLLPALAADELLDVHSDLYVAARQPTPAFAYFAGDFI